MGPHKGGRITSRVQTSERKGHEETMKPARTARNTADQLKALPEIQRPGDITDTTPPQIHKKGESKDQASDQVLAWSMTLIYLMILMRVSVRKVMHRRALYNTRVRVVCQNTTVRAR